MMSSCLNIDDLKSIAKLLEIGLSFKDVLLILENRQNKHIFEEITADLNRGYNPEKFFSRHLNKYLSEHFNIFTNQLSFSKSLLLSLKLYEKRNNLKNILIKKLIYPLGLFSLSFLGIYIFNNYFFDSLMVTLNSFSDNLSYLYSFKRITDFFIYLLLIIFLILAILMLYFIQPNNYLFGYNLLSKVFKHNIIKRYITNEFVVYFKEMYDSGLKTKQIFESLKKLKSNHIISNIAYRINERLESGMSFDKAMINDDIDESFNYFIVLIDKSKTVVELLNDYYLINERYFLSLINKFTKVFQLITYSIIIFFIFFIYQVILSPLNMLAGI